MKISRWKKNKKHGQKFTDQTVELGYLTRQETSSVPQASDSFLHIYWQPKFSRYLKKASNFKQNFLKEKKQFWIK